MRGYPPPSPHNTWRYALGIALAFLWSLLGCIGLLFCLVPFAVALHSHLLFFASLLAALAPAFSPKLDFADVKGYYIWAAQVVRLEPMFANFTLVLSVASPTLWFCSEHWSSVHIRTRALPHTLRYTHTLMCLVCYTLVFGSRELFFFWLQRSVIPDTVHQQPEFRYGTYSRCAGQGWLLCRALYFKVRSCKVPQTCMPVRCHCFFVVAFRCYVAWALLYDHIRRSCCVILYMIHLVSQFVTCSRFTHCECCCFACLFLTCYVICVRDGGPKCCSYVFRLNWWVIGSALRQDCNSWCVHLELHWVNTRYFKAVRNGLS